MAKVVREVMASNLKRKEQVATITEMTIKDKNALAQLFDVLQTGTDVERGTHEKLK